MRSRSKLSHTTLYTKTPTSLEREVYLLFHWYYAKQVPVRRTYVGYHRDSRACDMYCTCTVYMYMYTSVRRFMYHGWPLCTCFDWSHWTICPNIVLHFDHVLVQIVNFEKKLGILIVPVHTCHFSELLSISESVRYGTFTKFDLNFRTSLPWLFWISEEQIISSETFAVFITMSLENKSVHVFISPKCNDHDEWKNSTIIKREWQYVYCTCTQTPALHMRSAPAKARVPCYEHCTRFTHTISAILTRVRNFVGGLDLWDKKTKDPCVFFARVTFTHHRFAISWHGCDFIARDPCDFV